MDQSINRSPTEDDECYGIDYLDDVIYAETQELLANDTTGSFLLKGLDKSIEQSDLESCECEAADDSDSICCIESVNTPYPIDEKKPELKSLPQHLEYAYLHGDKSFPIIISSKLSEREKMLLLQVLEKRKGVIAWKMLVPSCFVIFDLEPLSLSFDFVFMSEIFKSLSFRLDHLCHLAILCLDQHAHTLHHLESLLTISLDRLDIFEGRSCISEFVRKSLSLILELS
ncbi:hypothetical protein Tco_1279945 [Tanacetum coccineum]